MILLDFAPETRSDRFKRELEESLRLLMKAQALAWHALPISDRKKFLAKAKEAR